MINEHLPFIPDRPMKPRTHGLAMVMDKGLSLREAEDLVDRAGHLIDFIKLGFGTSLFTNRMKEKVKFYRDNNIHVYPGGTLFEAFIIRSQGDKFLQFLDTFGFDAAEVSDGSIIMNHQQKCDWIQKLAQHHVVLSEVGAKASGVELSTEQWISCMKNEIEAGSFKVIAEARESGTVGIFDSKGKANQDLIEAISEQIDLNTILWEAPQKSQQAWFVSHFGANVNLGNIAPAEIIALETLRTGLRGDTFFEFLPASLQKYNLATQEN